MSGRSAAILLLSAAAGVGCYGLKPNLPSDALWARLCCSLAAVWSVCGWFVSTHQGRRPVGQPPPPLAISFYNVALLLGSAGALLLLAMLAPMVLERLSPARGGAIDMSRLPRTEGPADLVALLLALAFWRRGWPLPVQSFIGLSLGWMCTLWLAMLIPGGLLGDPTETLAPRPRWAPAWLLWTHVIQFGAGMLLVGSVVARDRQYRRIRANAWPAQLEQLLMPYPGTLATYLLSAMTAAIVLTLGVFHVVRPGGITIITGMIGFVVLLAAGCSILYWSHRAWSDNLAGLGLGLLAFAVVTLVCTLTPDQAGVEYAARLPGRLTAAVIALALVALVYLWLPGFWKQQLLADGSAWTTAGRLIPMVQRAGFMVAALGVLVGYYLAFWPRNRLAVAAPVSAWQWAFGLLGYFMLARLTARGARNYSNGSLAVLSLAAILGGLLFAFIRWPAGALRGWIVEHAPLLFVSGALLAWALSHRVRGTPSAAFSRPLWLLALLVLPVLALLHASGKPAAEWLNLPRWFSMPARLSQPWMRPATLGALAALYGLAGWREQRPLLRWLCATLAVAMTASLVATYR